MEGILNQIEALSKAKGIDPDIVVQAVKDAILVAARKYYKTNEELIAEFRAEDGHVDVFAVKVITEVVSNPGREISLAEARQIDPNNMSIRYQLARALLQSGEKQKGETEMAAYQKLAANPKFAQPTGNQYGEAGRYAA